MGLGEGLCRSLAAAGRRDPARDPRRRGLNGLPAPGERFGERRSKRDYGVSGSVLGHEVAAAGFQAGDRDSTRVAADGSSTVVFAHGDGWSVSVLGSSLADHERSETYSVRLDPGGRPLELVVSIIGELDGGAGLPESVAPVASSLLARGASSRSFAVEAHLDLVDPANAALAAAFVDDVRHPRIRIGAVLGPAERLRERLHSDGTIEARVYAVEHRQLGSPEESATAAARALSGRRCWPQPRAATTAPGAAATTAWAEVVRAERPLHDANICS